MFAGEEMLTVLMRDTCAGRATSNATVPHPALAAEEIGPVWLHFPYFLLENGAHFSHSHGPRAPVVCLILTDAGAARLASTHASNRTKLPSPKTPSAWIRPASRVGESPSHGPQFQRFGYSIAEFRRIPRKQRYT